MEKIDHPNGQPSAPDPILAQDVQSANAPPSYEEAMGMNQSSINRGQQELPPLAYIDIMPRFLSAGNLRYKIAPTFQKFSDIIDGANMWLAANHGLQCWKCETVERRVDLGPKIDLESMKLHQSTYGFNVYVLGVRMWLTKNHDNAPPQQLGLINVVPHSREIELERYHYGYIFNDPMMYPLQRHRTTTFTTFEGLADTLERFNENLKKNPLPGSILNVETATLKCSGFSASRDPDNASFSEIGANNFSFRRHCQILRVFYVKGPPRNEQIHMKEIVPEIVRQSGLVGSAVFEPFQAILIRAQLWLQAQSGIRIVNIETRDARVHENIGTTLTSEVNTDSTDEFDSPFWETKFVKILRIFYVDTPEVTSYSSTVLTSRLFPPLRIGMKTFENMSQTMARIAAWLAVTRSPIFGVETLQFPFIDNDSIGINPERCDYRVPKHTGKLWITAIRLYFPTVYQEPPRELLPPTFDWLTQGEGRGTVSCTLL